MKKSWLTFYLLLFLLCLLSRPLWGQSGTAKSLAIGNKWIYSTSEALGWPERRFHELITNDTTFSEKIYAVIRRGPHYTVFERADSIQIYRPFGSSESIVCDFRLKVGDRFGPYTVTRTYSREIWGKQRKVVHFYAGSIIAMSEEVYAEGIGMVSSWSDAHGSPPSSTRLIGAVLDGVIYGDTILTSVEEQLQDMLPSTIHLYQNYPNPFNAGTNIQFSIPQAGWVRIQIFDLTGTQVRVLANAYHRIGDYTINWDGNDDQGRTCASGIYFSNLSFFPEKGSGKKLVGKKLVLTR